MRREFKFRTWDIDNHIMSEPFDILALAANHFDRRTLEAVDFMQYTGLKDKNGREIYEGDIVKTSEGNYAVEWRGAPWGYKHVMWHSMYEVIGNIYENKELLDESH